MKKIIPIIIFVLLATNVFALTDSERADIKDKLLASSRNPDAFKIVLEELNQIGIDLSDEQYLKDTIILKANLFDINLKNYDNIKGLFLDEKKEQLNIEQEKYPTTDFEKKPSIKLGKYTNILIYIIILIVIIILAFFFTKYKDKFKSKKKISPQEISIKQKIEQARKKGYSDEQILTQFLKHGHKEEDIKKLM